jgi:hypothetical protein
MRWARTALSKAKNGIARLSLRSTRCPGCARMDAEDLVGRLVHEIGLKVLSIHGASALSLLASMVDDVMTRTPLTKKEREEFEDHADLFVDSFADIVKSNNKGLTETAFKALSSAMFVSAYYAGGPRALQRLKDQINKERTKKAHEAWRKETIREIVARNSRSIWEKNPELKKQPHITAYRIRRSVLRVRLKTPIRELFA